MPSKAPSLAFVAVAFLCGLLLFGQKPVSAPSQNAVSAGTLTGALNNGAAIAEKGARWTVFAAASPGTASSAPKALGAAGVRHVADCASFSAVSTGAVTAATTYVEVLDGATIVYIVAVAFPTAAAAGVQVLPPVSVCGLNLAGTAATAMSITFLAGVANVQEVADLSGFDVQ